jgi:hypothetical protein
MDIRDEQHPLYAVQKADLRLEVRTVTGAVTPNQTAQQAHHSSTCRLRTFMSSGMVLLTLRPSSAPSLSMMNDWPAQMVKHSHK